MVEHILNQYKQKIDPIMIAYLDKKARQYRKMFPQSIDLISQVKDMIIRGGDRIRPVLFYYGFSAIRKPNDRQEKELLHISTAFELFHTFALIHDDIIDESENRRGKQTVHTFFNRKFANLWGEKLALLAGDFAEICSQEIFSSSLFAPFLPLARKWFVQMKERTIIGEYMDTVFPLLGKIPSIGEIYNMYLYKTAFYSIGAPLGIGAIIAGATKRQVSSLMRFGDKAGIGFQIQDDILGIFGEQQLTGKSTISDIEEKKMTPLIVYTLHHVGSPIQKTFMNKFFSKEKTKEDIEYIKKTIKESGALKICEKECNRLVMQAKSILQSAKLRHQPIHFLSQLSDFLITRQY